MIFSPVGEVGGLVETVLLGRLGHQLVLDDILQQHALAIGLRVVGEARADFGGGEIEIGLFDIDAIDVRDDRVVGKGCHWRNTDQGCDEQQG